MTALVLLHAFPLESAMYAGVVHHYPSEVVTIDLLGFGGTPAPEGEPSLDRYADAVAAELDRIGLDEVVLGGTSMGGYTAMSFCRRHGDRVAGLALIDTKASADQPDAARSRRDMADRMDATGSADALVESVLPKLLGASTQRARPEVTAQVEGWVKDAPATAVAFAQRAMAARPDSFDTLRDVRVPSLVLVGDEDVLSTLSDAEQMAELLPDSELVVLPGVGHLSPVEAPESVAAALHGLMLRVNG